MTPTLPQAVIRAVAIPRFDAGAVGVHLAWSGPELTPLAVGGYEVRRRLHRDFKTTTLCASSDTARYARLAETRVLLNELGLMLLHAWRPPPTSAIAPAAENFAYSVFTQRLNTPTDHVSVICAARAAFAIATSAGKSTGVAIVTATGVALAGQAIDTVVVYALIPTALRICAAQPAEPDEDAASWAAADVIATGLTLPLREVDPSLATPSQELAKARERLVTTETFTQEEAEHVAAALRRAVAGGAARPCERVLLDRTDPTSMYQETVFSTRIALFTLDPRLRRVLGFGFIDTTAVQGQTYDYRVSGKFMPADLAEDVYDVHQIASGTALPTTFRIGDLTLRLGAPTEVVLDPAPAAEGLTAISRRGIALTPGDALGGFVPWWPSGLSCVIDLPRPVTGLVLEIPAAHGFSYAGQWRPPPARWRPSPRAPRRCWRSTARSIKCGLSGPGVLYAVRLPTLTSNAGDLSQVCGPVLFAPIPSPAPPVGVAVGLQTPTTITTGVIDEQTPRPRDLNRASWVSWEPAILGAIQSWPDDLDADPPIDSLAFVIEHRRVYDDTTADPWEAIQAGGNLTFGSWPASQGAPSLAYGVNLGEAFPLHRRRAAEPW